MDYFGLTDYDDFGYDYEREVLMERYNYLKIEMSAINKVFKDFVDETVDDSGELQKAFVEWQRRSGMMLKFLNLATGSVRLTDRTVNKKKFMDPKVDPKEATIDFFKKITPNVTDAKHSEEFNMLMLFHNTSDVVNGMGWILFGHTITDYVESELNKKDYPDVRKAVESVVGKAVEDFEAELTKERERRHSRY